MQWRKWRKIASLWRFELDAKSGPLEAGDFGEKSPILATFARGLAIMAINVPGPWRLAILAKSRQPFSPMRAFLDISLKSGRSLLRNLVVVTYKTVGRLHEVVNFEKGSLCDCDVDMLWPLNWGDTHGFSRKQPPPIIRIHYMAVYKCFDCASSETHKGFKPVTCVQCSWIFTFTIFGNLSEGYLFSAKWLPHDHHAMVLRPELCISLHKPLKDKKWKEKVQKNARFSFCGGRDAFQQEIALRGTTSRCLRSLIGQPSFLFVLNTVLSKMNNHEHWTKQTYESYTCQPLKSFWFHIIAECETDFFAPCLLSLW